MKKSTILRGLLTMAFVAMGMSATFAQPATIPGVNGETLSRHGYNSGGTAVAPENTDSVTTGSVMRYYALPDATANPSVYVTFNRIINGCLCLDLYRCNRNGCRSQCQCGRFCGIWQLPAGNLVGYRYHQFKRSGKFSRSGFLHRAVDDHSRCRYSGSYGYFWR